MHIVCIPAGQFRCIHLFRTFGDSNPALIINHFRGQKPGMFTDVYKFAPSKKSGAIFAAGGYFFMSFFIRAKAALSSSSSGSCA
jgi:hypothetical protein